MDGCDVPYGIALRFHSCDSTLEWRPARRCVPTISFCTRLRPGLFMYILMRSMFHTLWNDGIVVARHEGIRWRSCVRDWFETIDQWLASSQT